MRKIHILLLVPVIFTLFFLFLPLQSKSEMPASHVALIPLDSRPCNTDYIFYVCGAIGKTITLPHEGLDHYTDPSNPEKLYEFLYDSLSENDTYLIYTNQLLNGGLIASRDPRSYDNLEEKLDEFELFLKEARSQNKQVAVISVVPRVLPSQFTELWKYASELLAFSAQYGQLSLAEETVAKNHAPPEIIREYMSIYEGSDQIVERMKALVEEEAIDLFIIGQDDTHPESINNQYIHKYLGYDHPQIVVQPGADELTKLVLARFLREESDHHPLNLNLVYTHPEASDAIKTFEAFSTSERMAQMLTFLSLTPDKESDNITIIHNDRDFGEQTLKNLEIHRQAKYLSLIDTAYINRADARLFETFTFINRIDGYSGWNTVGNAIGTELANFVIHDYLNRTLATYPPEQREKMLANYYMLQYIHYADDYLYQSQLRDKLNLFLRDQGQDTTRITDTLMANRYLANLFTQKSDVINNSFPGEYYRFGQSFRIHQVSGDIYLPWERTFEAAIVPDLSVELIN